MKEGEISQFFKTLVAFLKSEYEWYLTL